MSWHLPSNILSALRTRYETDPNKLTAQEIELVRRTCRCNRCGHIWLSRRRKRPLRCIKCHAYRWDTPLLDAILHAEATANREPEQAVTQ